MVKKLFASTKAKIGGAASVIGAVWQATKFVLDYVGRYQTMRDVFPPALNFLSQPWVGVVVFIGGVTFILWARSDVRRLGTAKESQVRMSLAIFVITGAVVGAIVGGAVWTLTRPRLAIQASVSPTATETPAPSVADTASKDGLMQKVSPNLEVKRRYELLERLTDEYILTHTGVSAQLLEHKEYPPVEWVNERLKQLAETWRFEDRDRIYRLSKYEAMTNQELQQETLTFVAELRAFNNQWMIEDRKASERAWNERVNAPKEKQQELWQKENADSSARHMQREANYNEKFRGTALSLCSVLRTRVPELAKAIGSGSRAPILLDYGSFAGPDAIGDAADYLDQLARGLPVK